MRQCFAVLFMFVLSAVSVAQQGASRGLLEGRNFKSEQCGFSFVIQNGWAPASEQTLGLVRRSVPDLNEATDYLVIVSEPEATGSIVVLEGVQKDAPSHTNAEIGKQYVEKALRAPKSSVVRKPFRILLGGIDFYRTDIKEAADGRERFTAILATGRRGCLISLRAQAWSQDGVDAAVGMLIGAFHVPPDWSVPDAQLDKSRMRIRVSMGVEEGLLTKKVAPVYPAEAKRAKAKGFVVLGAEISRTGDVQKLWIDEGDPLLTGAAVDAVRQWKYRPYLLNGEPVIVETKIVIEFELR